MHHTLLKSVVCVLGSLIFELFLARLAYAAEEYVIVSVTPQTVSINIGQLYKVGDVVRIPSGVTITLMGADGSITTIQGPENIGITAEINGSTDQTSTLSKIGALLAGSAEAAQVLGAARSFYSTSNQIGAGSDPWIIHVDAQDVGCTNSNEIRLRRLIAVSEVDVLVTMNPSGENSMTRWPKDEMDLRIDVNHYKNSENASMQIIQMSKTVIIKKLPAEIQQEDHLGQIEWMIDNGCNIQAMLLIKRLTINAEALESGS